MLKVIFICTGNSCRSQMAEGLANSLYGDILKAYSAGSNPAGYVHPLAIDVMKEIGIDISGNISKKLDTSILSDFDYAITVCGEANEACPNILTNCKKLHWEIKDPARFEGSLEDKMNFFRIIRDEIKERIISFVNEVTKK